MKIQSRKYLFMDFQEFKEVLDEANISNSKRIIFILKIIKYFVITIFCIIHFWFYYYRNYEFILMNYFEQSFGKTYGSLLFILLVITIVVICFFLFEILFCFLPKIVTIKILNNKHQNIIYRIGKKEQISAILYKRVQYNSHILNKKRHRKRYK